MFALKIINFNDVKEKFFINAKRGNRLVGFVEKHHNVGSVMTDRSQVVSNSSPLDSATVACDWQRCLGKSIGWIFFVNHHQTSVLKVAATAAVGQCSCLCQCLSSIADAFILLALFNFGTIPVPAITLEGSTSSYARFPRWHQAFENVLSVELRTKKPNALLIYIDDSGLGNFYEISIFEGKIRLQFRLGARQLKNNTATQLAVNGTRAKLLQVEEVQVDDGQWHRVVLYHFWETVKLQVDHSVVFSKVLDQQDFVFADYEQSSDVYVGGLPVAMQASSLSFPFAKTLPRFEGSIRNLIYRTVPHGITAPSILQADGIRESDNDYCTTSTTSYCSGHGICYSSDTGPMCNCDLGRYGDTCLSEKKTLEVMLFAGQLFGFDRWSIKNGILSRSEQVKLQFKTRRQSGLLFLYGNDMEFVRIALQNGAVSAVSKLQKTVQDARVVPFKSNFADQKLGFGDGQWHSLTFSRKLNQVKLSVDDVFSSVRDVVEQSMFYTNFIYVGGVMQSLSNETNSLWTNFSGCLRNVHFIADQRQIDLLEELNRRQSGVVQTVVGNVTRECRRSLSVEAVTFVNWHSSLALTNRWTGGNDGQLVAFKFRTNEPYGLLLHCGPAEPHLSDFLAVEIFAGHLYFLINLGSGTTRLQASGRLVADGHWHSVNMTRRWRSGQIYVDNWRVDFSTPGKEKVLDTANVFQFGYSTVEARHLPPSVWTATLGRGFVGCLKDVTLDGVSLDLIGLLPHQSQRDVVVGCYDMLPQCTEVSCRNGGRCIEGWNRYHCDCSAVFYSGDRCEQEMFVANFESSSQIVVNFFNPIRTQVEDVRLKFRSKKANALLMLALDLRRKICFGLRLVNRRLEFFLSSSTFFQNVHWDVKLRENYWHSIALFRTGQRLELVLDGDRLLEKEIIISFMQPLQLQYDRLYIGSAEVDAIAEQREKMFYSENDHFEGEMADFQFNGLQLLTLAWHGQIGHSGNGADGAGVGGAGGLSTVVDVRSINVLYSAERDFVVSFQADSFAKMSLEKSTLLDKKLEVSFTFRTTEKNGVLLYRHGDSRNFLLVELFNGRLICRFNSTDYKHALQSDHPLPLNDHNWHHVVFYDSAQSGEIRLVVDNYTSNWSSDSVRPTPVRYNASLVIGYPGVEVAERLVDVLQSERGFQGCLVNFKIDGSLVRLLQDSEMQANLRQGCTKMCQRELCIGKDGCPLEKVPADCDCLLTEISDLYCFNQSVAYRFGPRPGTVLFRLDENSHVGPVPDRVLMGMVTYQADAVVMQMVTLPDNRQTFELLIENGYFTVKFRDQYGESVLSEKSIQLNDGQYHFIQFNRSRLDLSLQIDQKERVATKMKGQTSSTTASWMKHTDRWIALGGRFDGQVQTKRRHFRRDNNLPFSDAFYGILSSVLVNDYRLLELASAGDERVILVGDVRRHHFNHNESQLETTTANEETTTTTTTTTAAAATIGEDIFASNNNNVDDLEKIAASEENDALDELQTLMATDPVQWSSAAAAAAAAASATTTTTTASLDELLLSGEGDSQQLASCSQLLDDEDCSAEQNELITPVFRFDEPDESEPSSQTSSSTTSQRQQQQTVTEPNHQKTIDDVSGSANLMINPTIESATFKSVTGSSVPGTGLPYVTLLSGRESKQSTAPETTVKLDDMLNNKGFPRTSVIAGVSVGLVVLLTLILFYVFKCRQDPHTAIIADYTSINNNDDNNTDGKSNNVSLDKNKQQCNNNNSNNKLNECFAQSMAVMIPRYASFFPGQSKSVKEWYV
ncbi:Neurexin-1a [Trichinella pseudospiralis]|uniref:Neurexin-1a n=1 Tax=Trichinella pseudospiralis TaxID=6337 RepID=A0A0V1JRP8_TRIPS|nr:Neurexin-1a [Trichinella pseudospiralis]